jgi:uncharacterized protein YdeI (YjbR/CyaY-like superfamily)
MQCHNQESVMELHKGDMTLYAKSRKDWRNWLQKNQDKEKRIRLILYRKGSKTPSVSYEECIEEALCFGWIDSTANTRDAESYFILIAQRKPGSNWSKPNRIRAEKMINQGLMKPRGQAMIDLAKQTGTWTALEEIENSIIPEDLQKRFDKNQRAFRHFQAFSPSSQRIILEWIMKAKRPETRQKRVAETVAQAAKNIKAYP